jgi:hypothetical protein
MDRQIRRPKECVARTASSLLLIEASRQAAPNHGIIIANDALNRAWITEGMQSAPCEQNPKSEMRSHLE